MSKASDPQYIYVDLGKQYNICHVTLHWQAALGKDFKIQVSNDASAWSDVATFAGNVSLNNLVSMQTTGRYVRVYGTARGTTSGYGLYEIEVNGSAVVDCLPPQNLSSTSITSSSAMLNWTSNGASAYAVQYKTVTAIDWNQLIAADNNITLNNLACNTPYQYRIRSICAAKDSSDFSDAAGFTTLACTINCDPLPTRWFTQDIGNTGVAGSACYQSSSATFQLHGSGSDIWGTQDAFRFAYKTITAGGEIIARVATQDNVNTWNKCGIMIRESLAEGSRHAFIALTSANGVAFQNRLVTDGSSNNVNTGVGIKAPYWLKLVVLGTNYTGYMSPDGKTWTKVGNTVDAGFGNGSPVYAGLAISSHDNTLLSTATVDNFTSDVILPLKLISFTGRFTLDHTVVLEWITTQETRTDHFIVERRDNGGSYAPIDTVDAKNNADFTQDYDATDDHPLPGTNYYRLKIVDMDGNVSYSSIVAVKVEQIKSPTMYPNPADNSINIWPGSDPIRQINIYNILSQPVLKIANSSSQGKIEIPTYSFSNGLYFVEIRTASVVYMEKLLIHH
jgi:hypothetical protein